MMAAASLRHPGAARVPRRLARQAGGALTFWVELDSSRELFDACSAAAMRHPGQAILFRVAGLELERAALHFVEDGLDHRMIRYGEPVRFDAPCILIAAHMMLGWQGGRPVPHAHGCVASHEGDVFGGHLSPGTCFLRRDRPAQAHMTVLAGCALVPQPDEETGFRLLSPCEAEVH